MQTIGGREPMRGELGRFYDAIENPRATRNELPILRGDELRSYMARGPRADAGRARRASTSSGRATRCCADGFVYELILAHEHQHNETMLQLLQMVEELRARRARRRTRDRAGRRRAGDGARSRAASSRSATRADGFAYDNERPRHTVELAAVRDRPHPGDQRARTREFVEETGAEPPLYWEPDGEGGWVRTAMGRDPRSRPRPPGRPRRLARAPTRFAAVGRQAAADRARVGGRRGRRRPEPRQSRPPRVRDRAGRRLCRRGVGLRRRPDAGRRLGVDQLGLHRLPGLRGLPVRRVLQGLLRRRAQGAARRRLGDAPRRDPDDLPELGPAEQAADLLRPSLRQGRDEDAAASTGHRSTSTCRPGGPLSGMAADVRVGLTKPFKELSPRYFYDERGSELFERITATARVLPDARRAGDPRGALARDRRGGGRAGDADRARLGLGGQDAGPARRDAATRAACAHTRPSTSPRRSRATLPLGSPTSTGIDVHGLVCDFERDLERIPLVRPAPDRLPGRHDRQLRAPAARQLPGPGREPAGGRRPLPAGHRPGQGPRRRSRPPTTTPQA